jgi:hypothetical protein
LIENVDNSLDFLPRLIRIVAVARWISKAT